MEEFIMYFQKCYINCFFKKEGAKKKHDKKFFPKKNLFYKT